MSTNAHFAAVEKYAEWLPNGQLQITTEWDYVIRTTIVTNDNRPVEATVGWLGTRGAFHAAYVGGDPSKLRTLSSLAQRAATFAGHVEECRQRWLADEDVRPSE
jgi:hypothetical protein